VHDAAGHREEMGQALLPPMTPEEMASLPLR
jgi:hypothetical protein